MLLHTRCCAGLENAAAGWRVVPSDTASLGCLCQGGHPWKRDSRAQIRRANRREPRALNLCSFGGGAWPARELEGQQG